MCDDGAMTMLSVPSALGQVGLSGTPDAFEAVGFDVSDNGLLAMLNGALAFSEIGAKTRFLGIGVAGDEIADGVNLDGIPVIETAPVPPVEHPNGCYEIDHLVLMTPDLDRTARHAEAVLGLRQLRLRDGGKRRQSFHRFADVTHPDGDVSKGAILELVEDDRLNAPRLWGVVFNAHDLDAVVDRYPRDVIGEPRSAVQNRRRIASFKPGAGLGVAVAVMSPPTRQKRTSD